MEKLRNIKEEYKVGAKIGTGNVAIVRKVRNRQTCKNYAAKIFNKQRIRQQEVNLGNEIRMLKILSNYGQIKSHPHVCLLHDVFVDEGHIILIMDYLSGESLLNTILQRGRLSEDNTRDCIYSLIKAVQHCH